jgi:8-oxo-dGTP diphosphatase
MMYEFSGAYGGHVTLSFDRDQAKEPGYVLVFPFYKGQLVMAKHERRGWEVPGGTREPGETPLGAAIRETYEETGAELDAIEWIGQYTIQEKDREEGIKSVYIARVVALQGLPAGFETEEIRLFKEWPTPEQIRKDPSFSPIMKDGVYQYVLGQICQLRHPFAYEW